MKEYLKKHLTAIISGAISLVVMWLVWLIAERTVKNEYVIPSFSQTLQAVFKVLGEEFFWRALLNTLLRTLYAFLISFVLAGVTSALGRIFKPFSSFLTPIITVIRTLPTMAVLVLILIYTSVKTAPVIVASLVLFPMIYAQFNVAFGRVDDGIIKAVKIFKLTKKQRLFKVYLPLVAPTVVSHIGSNLSFGVKLVISAEVMALTFTSIGGMMQAANAVMNVPRLMALTLVAVLIGLVFELIGGVITRSLFAWDKKEKDND